MSTDKAIEDLKTLGTTLQQTVKEYGNLGGTSRDQSALLWQDMRENTRIKLVRMIKQKSLTNPVLSRH
jgi:hypothetical protein